MKNLEQLWDTPAPSAARFKFESVNHLPDIVARYLRHAIAPGTPVATAVRLRMHGEMKLGTWRTFDADQVIHRDRGMVWQARTRMFGLPVTGYDRFVGGVGEMRWKIARVLPLVSGRGPDIARSAAGRWKAELIWLPPALLGEHVEWSTPAPDLARANFALTGDAGALDLRVGEDGRLISVKFARWGNPGGGAFAYHDFGALVNAEETFGGYTIPTQVRVGWYFDGAHFQNEGEFFRATIDNAEFR